MHHMHRKLTFGEAAAFAAEDEEAGTSAALLKKLKTLTGRACVAP